MPLPSFPFLGILESDVRSGVQRKRPLQLKCPGKANLTLDQKGKHQRQDVHLDFILTQVVMVSLARV